MYLLSECLARHVREIAGKEPAVARQIGTADGYNMKVINRYGEVIFETDDINEGWLGTYNNKTVELGSYGYVITFTATNGQVITKKGNVTVVR